MLISQTAEYALRAMVHLGSQHGQPQTNRQIADATRVPAGYLAKVMQALGRAALVRAQRGVGGGFTLGREPGQITILEVVNAVDPLQRIKECPLGLPAHGTNLCALHRKLDDALATVEHALRSSTLASLLATSGKSKPLCDVTVSGAAAAGKKRA